MHTIVALLVALQVGVIAGRVRSNDGIPAQQVNVTVAEARDDNTPGFTKETVTDQNGRFRLENIPPGRYYLKAGRPEAIYYPGETVQAAAEAFSVSANRPIEGIDFALPESAAAPSLLQALLFSGPAGGASVQINVHVAADPGLSLPLSTGKPIQVTAKPLTWIGGVQKKQEVTIASLMTGARYGPMQTNVPALPAEAKGSVDADGSAVLSISNGAEYQFAVDNLPDDFEVKAITWGAIDLRRFTLQTMNNFAPSGIQVRLGRKTQRAGARTGATVRGKFIDGITGKDWTAVAVSLSGTPGTLFADGSFEFSNVRPGSYVLHAREGPPGDREAESTLTVSDSDVTTNIVYTSAPVYIALKGRVVVERGAALPSGLRIILKNKGPLAVGEDGTFKTALSEGSYDVSVADLPSGFSVKSISAGSADLIAAPLRIKPQDGPMAADILVTISPAPAQ